MLKPNIQLFADGDTPPPAQETTPFVGKTFTEDYVSTLRGESAGYRTKAKTYEGALKTLLELQDGEDLGDINARIGSFKQAQETKLGAAQEAANKRLVIAEMRGLEDYNLPLLERLIDLKGVKVEDDGKITGLTEAISAVVQAFPEAKKTPPPFSRGAKGPTQDLGSTTEKANAAIRAAFGK